jgi:LPXTG-motif cell wall-anchored protein
MKPQSTLSVNSPQNKTYETNIIPLTFTVNGPVSSISFSLDGQKTVAISGNNTLYRLAAGPHSLSVSVKDSAGNTGTSEIIYFTVADEPATKPNPELFSTQWIAATIIGVAIVILAAFIVYFKRNKKK